MSRHLDGTVIRYRGITLNINEGLIERFWFCLRHLSELTERAVIRIEVCLGPQRSAAVRTAIA